MAVDQALIDSDSYFMCGITGALDPDVQRGLDTVARLNDWQRHRGPDADVAVRAGSFAIGSTRLAIQEPTPLQNQPFVSRDGRFVCVFNGEIYNFKELIQQYRLDPTSRCDGAVIPELWMRFGVHAMEQFRGMFAIAVVDTATDVLTLARDPFGIKPLYLRRLPDQSIAFASEVRALIGLQTMPEISATAIADFFHLGAIPAAQTPFESMIAVAPNEWLQINPRDHDPIVEAHRGRIVDDEHPLTFNRSEGSLADEFRRSVYLHLRSDVPTALLLSSGVDSSAIACAARDIGRQLHCFTVRIAGLDDEAPAAARLAENYGHVHTTVAAELSTDDPQRFVEAMQRPTIDGLNTFLVSKAISAEGYRVALSGLGADEALGGYTHMRMAPLVHGLRLLDRLPGADRALLSAIPTARHSEKLADLLAPSGPRGAMAYDTLQRRLFSPDIAAQLVGTRPSTESSGSDGLSRRDMTEAEITQYLQRTLLPDADCFSMSWSIELRVPFVDRPFFGNAMRNVAFAGKRALARSLGDPSLVKVARRSKLGFTVPMRQWMSSGPLRPMAAAIEDPSALVWEHVDQVQATKLLSCGSDRWSEPWSFAVLNAWLGSVTNGRNP